MDAELLAEFRETAKTLTGIDLPIYETFGADPRQPVVGEGDPAARIALFGRDPGREEIRHQMPFIGAGGQKVRQVLHRVLCNAPLSDFASSVRVGRHVFWANTVPYKPVGNKAWSMAVKKRFQPLMVRLLSDAWRGRDILTLGREAFFWFGIGLDRQQRASLNAFWARADRFEAVLDWTLICQDRDPRPIRLHPLPHPSPLNATWYQRFEGLLEARLRGLSLGSDNWRICGEIPTRG